MVAKVSRRVHGDFTHVVSYGHTSALRLAEAPLLLDGASYGPAGRWVLLQRVRYPGFPLAGRPLWAFRLGTGRDSDCRVQPRQTDAVYQFVAREANGCKAEGFSGETESFTSMSHSEEASLLHRSGDEHFSSWT